MYNTFGYLDASQKKGPSATLHYHSTVLLLMANRKRLMKWLKSMSFKKRKQVMDNAKRNGKLLRAMHRRLLILCHWIPFIPKYFFLSSKAIDFVQETKYIGVMLNSQLKTSIDVSRQTRKFYAQANMLLRNFRHCSVDVKCMLFRSYCTNMYCCPLWFNSTSGSIKKLKSS